MEPVTARLLGRCLLAGSLACGVGAPPARAQEVEGGRDDRLKVRSLEIQGVSGLDVSQITDVLATRESGGMIPLLGKDRFFNPRQFQADLYRIIAFLSDQGWPRAKVDKVDIVRDAEDKAVDITVHVDQGAPVVIDRVETFGFDVLDARDQQSVQRRINLAAGRRRVQGDVRRTRSATLGVLQERGYAYAAVNVLEAEGSEPGHVALYVIAEPGPQATFGRITVRGNDGVSDGRVKSLLSL